MDKILNNIKNTKILAIIGLVCSLLGVMLPYIKINMVIVSSVTLSLWSYWEGKVMILLILINFMIIFTDLAKKYVPQLFNNNFGNMIEKFNKPKYSLIPTGLLVILTLYCYNTLNIQSNFVKFQAGCYLLWIGIICLLGYGLLYQSNFTFKKKTSNVGTQNVQITNVTQTNTNNQNTQLTNNSQTTITPQESTNNVPTNTENTNISKTVYCPNCAHKCENTNKCPICGKDLSNIG